MLIWTLLGVDRIFWRLSDVIGSTRGDRFTFPCNGKLIWGHLLLSLRLSQGKLLFYTSSTNLDRVLFRAGNMVGTILGHSFTSYPTRRRMRFLPRPKKPPTLIRIEPVLIDAKLNSLLIKTRGLHGCRNGEADNWGEQLVWDYLILCPVSLFFFTSRQLEIEVIA